MRVAWVNIIGIVLDLIGALLIAASVYVSQRGAVTLGVMRLAGETEEENLRLPAVRDRLKQSDAALWGGLFFIGGAVLQVVANWPT